MNILNIKKELFQKILESLPDSKDKEWLKLQYDEQTKGGAWKARIREQGHAI